MFLIKVKGLLASPVDSPGKDGKHIRGPSPYSLDAAAAEFLWSSSDHPGFCLHAETSPSATQLKLRQKHHVHMCAVFIHSYLSPPSLVSLPCQSVLHKTSRTISPKHQSILSLHGPGTSRPPCNRPPCCLQKAPDILDFLTTEVKLFTLQGGATQHSCFSYPCFLTSHSLLVFSLLSLDFIFPLFMFRYYLMLRPALMLFLPWSFLRTLDELSFFEYIQII